MPISLKRMLTKTMTDNPGIKPIKSGDDIKMDKIIAYCNNKGLKNYPSWGDNYEFTEKRTGRNLSFKIENNKSKNNLYGYSKDLSLPTNEYYIKFSSDIISRYKKYDIVIVLCQENWQPLIDVFIQKIDEISGRKAKSDKKKNISKIGTRAKVKRIVNDISSEFVVTWKDNNWTDADKADVHVGCKKGNFSFTYRNKNAKDRSLWNDEEQVRTLFTYLKQFVDLEPATGVPLPSSSVLRIGPYNSTHKNR